MSETISKKKGEIKEKAKQQQNTKTESAPVVSATIPIPEPRNPPPGFSAEAEIFTNSGEKTYGYEQLVDVGKHPGVQDYPGELPEEIDIKKLSGPARKRRFPFVDPRRKGVAQSNQNTQRWKGKEGRGDYLGKKNAAQQKRGDQENGDDDEENAEGILDQEKSQPNEAAPSWDTDNNKEIIDGPNFEFKVLDREKDRKLFQETGGIPDQPSFLSRQDYEKLQKEKEKALQKERLEKAEQEQREQFAKEWEEEKKKKQIRNMESNVANLFRTAGRQDNLAPVPDGALMGEALEQKSVLNKALQQRPMADFPPDGVSLLAYPPTADREKRREIGDHRVPGVDHPPSGASTRDQEELPPRTLEERIRPAGGHFDLNFGSRELRPDEATGDIPHSPTRDPNKAMYSPNKLPVVPQQQYANSLPSPHQQGLNGSPMGPSAQPPNGPQSNMSRLDTILYEVTSPVRPCVGGQFFANVRPLSNKELYDYSPKFKEIQDTRLKRHKAPRKEMQMRQHHAHYQRKRMMMQKYAQAKKLYAEHNQYPGAQRERYPAGPQMMEYQGRALHGPEYNRRRDRSEYDMHYHHELMRGRR